MAAVKLAASVVGPFQLAWIFDFGESVDEPSTATARAFGGELERLGSAVAEELERLGGMLFVFASWGGEGSRESVCTGFDPSVRAFYHCRWSGICTMCIKSHVAVSMFPSMSLPGVYIIVLLSSTSKLTLKTRLLSLTPHENIYTIPNILTFTRLLSAPLVGYLVLHDYHAWAVGLFAYAGITDLVDGWIARKWKLQTVVGTVIDPMADKMLMTILTGCLAWTEALPIWLAIIILSRDILLGIAAIYYRYISLPPPKTFSRYWDFSLPSAEVHPTGISKVNTALQLGLIGWTVGMPLLTGIGWGAGTGVETALLGMQ
ncbi:hypothetical protein MMC24_004687 [Lignoscripta atroalba]|nr:hypothetical protein [Lignoscripta atroalba]